ncbi:sulfatase [Seonamhaeicola aphaedonensis]|uniref:Arylsulfatase A-like enzyme n=1 Tax=Seonamhaeicola aphaedonensis TaxID=1461338 RepID=A0A3D9HKU7_9FLAO|nr:sulfatase [Seonamhaeicola aphaedonensis]RED50119.1 arylsulfatase A-like enzyme [Seonamhaeicola aphaedonensis]
MKYLKLSSICLFALFFTGCETKANKKNTEDKNTSRPNIIFILADDYGIMDSQAYANKFTGTHPDEMFYETPNIDKLVSEGTSFSQAYANQLCSPTRASILTGKYAGRLGFTTAMPPRATYYNQNEEVPKGYYIHDVYEHKDPIKIEQAITNGISNSAIPTGSALDGGRDELSIAEALKDYHSGFIGKWHLGGFGAKGYQPKNQGFEPLAWFDAGGSTYYNWRKIWNDRTNKAFPKVAPEALEIGGSGKETNETYLTDDLTVQALQFIEDRAKIKDKPFFLYFSHFAIHTPYQGKADEIAHFENKENKGWNGHDDPVYASMIKSLDRSVGDILNKLKELNIEDNTLVVFMSDNGGIDAEVTPNNKGTNNDPFLGGKACVTEGGIRVPLVFKWKGKVQKGKWVDVPVDCTDIYPSLLDAAGYNARDIVSKNNLDGESLIPVLSDIKNKKNSYTKTTHYWHYPFNVIYNSPFEPFALTPHSAIRDGDYKLIFDWYGRLYLYNIEKDPYEKNNLITENPELKDTMFNKLMSWLKLNVDIRYWPTVNENYNPKKEVRDTPFVDMFSSLKADI